jgi:hypothetical protein
MRPGAVLLAAVLALAACQNNPPASTPKASPAAQPTPAPTASTLPAPASPTPLPVASGDIAPDPTPTPDGLAPSTDPGASVAPSAEPSRAPGSDTAQFVPGQGLNYVSQDGLLKAIFPPGALSRKATVKFERIDTEELENNERVLNGIRFRVDLGGAYIVPGARVTVTSRADARLIAGLKAIFSDFAPERFHLFQDDKGVWNVSLTLAGASENQPRAPHGGTSPTRGIMEAANYPLTPNEVGAAFEHDSHVVAFSNYYLPPPVSPYSDFEAHVRWASDPQSGLQGKDAYEAGDAVGGDNRVQVSFSTSYASGPRPKDFTVIDTIPATVDRPAELVVDTAIAEGGDTNRRFQYGSKPYSGDCDCTTYVTSQESAAIEGDSKKLTDATGIARIRAVENADVAVFAQALIRYPGKAANAVGTIDGWGKAAGLSPVFGVPVEIEVPKYSPYLRIKLVNSTQQIYNGFFLIEAELDGKAVDMGPGWDRGLTRDDQLLKFFMPGVHTDDPVKLKLKKVSTRDGSLVADAASLAKYADFPLQRNNIYALELNMVRP